MLKKLTINNKSSKKELINDRITTASACYGGCYYICVRETDATAIYFVGVFIAAP